MTVVTPGTAAASSRRGLAARTPGPESERTDDRGHHLDAVAVVLVFLLATGRWGAYLRVAGSPIYLSDIVLGAGIALHLVRLAHANLSTRHLRRSLPLILLVYLAFVRLFLSAESYSFPLLRDLAPYMYPVVGVVAASYSTRRLAALLPWLIAGASFRVWTTLYSSLLGVPTWSPTVAPGVQVLSPRNDIDSAVAAALGVFLGARWVRVGLSTRLILTFLACLCRVFISNQSRAGILALIFAVFLLLTVWNGALPSHVARRLRRALVGCTVVGAAAVVLFGVSSDPVTRLVGTIDASDGSSALSGTAAARTQAWGAVVEHTSSNVGRFVLGVGFGPDYLDESGAVIAFEGEHTVDREVRAPHNYLLNTFARLGIVGVIVILALIVLVIRGWRSCAAADVALPHVQAVLFLSLLWGTILVTSLVGVVLESPFGAIPFFFACGVGLGARPDTGRTIPNSDGQQSGFTGRREHRPTSPAAAVRPSSAARPR